MRGIPGKVIQQRQLPIAILAGPGLWRVFSSHVCGETPEHRSTISLAAQGTQSARCGQYIRKGGNLVRLEHVGAWEVEWSLEVVVVVEGLLLDVVCRDGQWWT